MDKRLSVSVLQVLHERVVLLNTRSHFCVLVHRCQVFFEHQRNKPLQVFAQLVKRRGALVSVVSQCVISVGNVSACVVQLAQARRFVHEARRTAFVWIVAHAGVVHAFTRHELINRLRHPRIVAGFFGFLVTGGRFRPEEAFENLCLLFSRCRVAIFMDNDVPALNSDFL